MSVIFIGGIGDSRILTLADLGRVTCCRTNIFYPVQIQAITELVTGFIERWRACMVDRLMVYFN